MVSAMDPCQAARSRPARLLRYLPLLMLLLAARWGTPAVAFASDQDAQQILQTFGGYRSALLEGDGPAAANLLSVKTHSYYDEVRALALTEKAEALQRRPLAKQLQVLLYRTRVPQRVLESMSSTGLISHSVEQGWIARDSVAKVEPGKVDVRGDEAMLHISSDGEDRGPAFFFRREPAGWRLDLVPILRVTEKPLRDSASRGNMNVSDFLLFLVERAVGREVGVEAWIPLVDRSEDPLVPGGEDP